MTPRFGRQNGLAAGDKPATTTSMKSLKRMSSKFTVCMLTQGSRSAPEFLVSEVNLCPGRGYSPHSQETILLSSGFSSIAPDTDFPLSPTLQVNHDLGRLSMAQLQQLALAEIRKIQAASYRSYILRPDPRLCVIGNNAENLRTFLDNYGGIVAIEPVLTDGYARDLPTAIDPAVYRDRNAYRLEYTVRVPINTDRCTYCGACGAVCPQLCLDEQLFLDYSRCTYCNRCENVCSQNALDVHGTEQRLMRIPAIVLLEGTRIDLPEDRTAIYQEKDLPAYFANQYACRVDEVVTCDGSLCQYSTRLGAGCRICLDSCRYGAISQEASGVTVDSEKCEECGSCVAACATGAMQYQRCNDSAFITYFQDVGIIPGTTVILGSEKALHSLWWRKPEQDFRKALFVEYQQIQALSLFHLLFLYVSGAGRIVLLGLDEELRNPEAMQHQVSLACSLLDTCFQAGKTIEILTVPQFLGRPLAAVSAAASTSLPVFDEPLTGNRRENLAAVLKHLTAESGAQAEIKADDSVPFATIICDEERCSHCYACLNPCRIQALSTSREKPVLIFRAALCVGCGLCVRVCPENGLRMARGATLDAKFYSGEALSETEPMTCGKCGKVFGTRKSFERVMAILAGREAVDTSHFACCETCRVVNLFENA